MVFRGKVLTQTNKSSDNQLAGHCKLSGDKSGNNGLKIRIRLSKASSTEIVQMQKENKNDIDGPNKNNNDFSRAGPLGSSEKLRKRRKKDAFSFSIKRLLFVVRDALIAGHDKQNELPSLTISEILERVRSTPGDPNILTAKDPLLDLIRECLTQLSSRTPPKSWGFDKDSRSWAWISPNQTFCHVMTIRQEHLPNLGEFPEKIFPGWLNNFPIG